MIYQLFQSVFTPRQISRSSVKKYQLFPQQIIHILIFFQKRGRRRRKKGKLHRDKIVSKIFDLISENLVCTLIFPFKVENLLAFQSDKHVPPFFVVVVEIWLILRHYYYQGWHKLNSITVMKCKHSLIEHNLFDERKSNWFGIARIRHENLNSYEHKFDFFLQANPQTESSYRCMDCVVFNIITIALDA